jgi:hypothetical protein
MMQFRCTSNTWHTKVAECCAQTICSAQSPAASRRHSCARSSALLADKVQAEHKHLSPMVGNRLDRNRINLEHSTQNMTPSTSHSSAALPTRSRSALHNQLAIASMTEHKLAPKRNVTHQRSALQCHGMQHAPALNGAVSSRLPACSLLQQLLACTEQQSTCPVLMCHSRQALHTSLAPVLSALCASSLPAYTRACARCVKSSGAACAAHLA